jgi:hypothetical protein
VNSYKALRALCPLPSVISRMAIFVASLSISVVGASTEKVVVDSDHTLPSLMANYHLSHEPSQEIMARFKIMIGEDGLRIDQQGEGAKGSIILNNRLDKMWLLDRDLKIFHEVPLQVKTEDSSLISSTENQTSDDEGTSEAEYFAAFIQLKPCNGMQSERLPIYENDSDDMQVWQCKIDNKIVEKQWFDIEHGLVVKSESFDGLVARITDIQEVSNRVDYLKPPSKYRLVSLAEIISTSQPLNNYEEEKSLLIGSVASGGFMTESTNANNIGFADK